MIFLTAIIGSSFAAGAAEDLQALVSQNIRAHVAEVRMMDVEDVEVNVAIGRIAVREHEQDHAREACEEQPRRAAPLHGGRTVPCRFSHARQAREERRREERTHKEKCGLVLPCERMVS